MLTNEKQGIEPVLILAEDYKPELNEIYDFDVLFLKTFAKRIFKSNCFPYNCYYIEKII